MWLDVERPGWESLSGHWITERDFDCYLCSGYDDPNFHSWSGPRLLSPLTHAEGLFHYVSSIFPMHINWLEIQFSVIHKYTDETVAVLTFLLPRVEHTLGTLARCRERIWRLVSQYSRSKSGADFRFEAFIWPRDELGLSFDDKAGQIESISPEWALDPVRFVRNIYHS